MWLASWQHKKTRRSQNRRAQFRHSAREIYQPLLGSAGAAAVLAPEGSLNVQTMPPWFR